MRITRIGTGWRYGLSNSRKLRNGLNEIRSIQTNHKPQQSACYSSSLCGR
jgi:hypothetical protein